MQRLPLEEAIIARDDELRREGPRENEPVGERRWPMAVAVLATAVLQVIVPRRGRVAIWWLFPVLEVVLLVVLVARDPGRIDRRSETLRRLTLLMIAVMTVANSLGGLALTLDILRGSSNVTATILLARGGAIWVTNVIVFGLWYWEIDRGGPAERAARSGRRASFAFPEDATPELVRPGWMPTYPDYFYLSFTAATAFSPTDTLPIRIWAKMTMMAESAISLVLAIFVVARAINIIPG
jgi:uncharacterized membrane protein